MTRAVTRKELSQVLDVLDSETYRIPNSSYQRGLDWAVAVIRQHFQIERPKEEDEDE